MTQLFHWPLLGKRGQRKTGTDHDYEIGSIISELKIEKSWSVSVPPDLLTPTAYAKYQAMYRTGV